MLLVNKAASNHYAAFLMLGANRQVKREFMDLAPGWNEVRGTGVVEVRGVVKEGDEEKEREGWYYISDPRGDCFYLGPKSDSSIFKRIVGYLKGASYISLLDSRVRRQKLVGAIADLLGDKNLAEAVTSYILRRRGEEKPKGWWKGSERYSPWYPDDEEERSCCYTIRTPSYGYPLTLWKHCMTYRHIAALYNVGEQELRMAVNKVEDELCGPAGLYLFKRGENDDFPLGPERQDKPGYDDILHCPNYVPPLEDDGVWWPEGELY